MQKNQVKAERKKAEAEKKKAAAEKKKAAAEKKRVEAEEVGVWQCTRRRNHDIAMSTGTRIVCRKISERPKGRKLRLNRRKLRPKRLVHGSVLTEASMITKRNIVLTQKKIRKAKKQAAEALVRVQ